MQLNASMLDKIVRVVINDKKIPWEYAYQKERKGLFRVKPAHIVSLYIYNTWGIDEFLEANSSYFVENEVLYEKPEVRIIYIGDKQNVFIFDDFQDAKRFYKELLNSLGSHINQDGQIVTGKIY